jgi:hypothetical protein
MDVSNDNSNDSNGAPRTELRRSPRYRFFGVIFLSWIGPRGKNHVMGRCLDISEGGLGIEIANQISVDTEVTVRAEWANLDSTATVRYAQTENGVWHLGLELKQPLTPEVIAEVAAPSPQ